MGLFDGLKQSTQQLGQMLGGFFDPNRSESFKNIGDSALQMTDPNLANPNQNYGGLQGKYTNNPVAPGTYGGNPTNAMLTSEGIIANTGQNLTNAPSSNIASTSPAFDLKGGSAYSYNPPAQNQPMQAATQNIQPANLTPQPQTFGFGGDPGQGIAPTNFANYNPTNNQSSAMSQPTNSLTGQITSYQTGINSLGTPDISAKAPENITPSSSLGSGANNGTINSKLTANGNTTDNIFNNLNDLYNQQQQAAANIQSAGQVGQGELAAQGQVAQAQLGVGQANLSLQDLQAQAGGAYNPSGNPDLAFVTGAARNAEFGAQRNVISAQLQQQLAQTNLAYQQGNRQVAFATASKVFDATRNNLSDMLNLYTSTAPKNINTNYNPATGNMTLTMQSPITGETFQKVNNIGPQQSLVSTGSPFLDPNSGNYLQPFIQNGNTPVLIPLTGANAGQILQGENGAGGLQGNQPGTPAGLGSVAIPGYAGPLNPQTNAPWRTDANNNPIAAAVTTGGTNQFTKALDTAGVPWTYGSTFPNDPKMSTIKILGDPVEGARAILAGSNAIQGWYATSTGSSILKQYGVQNNAQFAASSTPIQNAIVDGIYKAEVGSGILTHPQNQQPTQGQTQQSQQNFQALQKAAPLSISPALNQAPDGSAYFDMGKLTDPQSQIAARAFINRAAQTGIKIPELQTEDVSLIKDATTTMNNLQMVATNFAQIADTSGVAAKARALTDPILKFFGSARGDLVKAYTSNRDTLFHQINTLAGSHPRINTNELEIASNAMPLVSSFNADTLNQGLDKLSITTRAVDNAIRSRLPNYQSPALQINGQYWVHASDGKNYFFPNQEAATQFKQQTNTP